MPRARRAKERERSKLGARKAITADQNGWPLVVANRDLRLADVPLPTQPLGDIFRFALTYQGYDEAGSQGACAEIANSRRHHTLHDLRACLFFEQRRWHHFGELPDGEDLAYFRGLVEQIRAKLRRAGRGVPKRSETSLLDPEVYKRGIDFAARAHKGMLVPGSGFPYVVHVAKVATEVIAATEGDTDLDRDLAVACALLHDTVEDSRPEDREALIRDMQEGFGKAVLDGVLALTKDENEPGDNRMADSLKRIQGQPREVWIVKLADRITNLEPPPPHWDPTKRAAYRREARLILAELGAAHVRLRQRLQEKIEAYGAWCHIEGPVVRPR